MNKIEIQQEAIKALEFIRSHPALVFDTGDSVFPGLWFLMIECNKDGISKSAGAHGISVTSDSPLWRPEFKDLEDTYEINGTYYSSIPYNVLYNKEWESDHVEYWYETCFFTRLGNPYIRAEDFDHTRWDRYSGPEGSALSYEEMLIDIAKNIKEVYGDFDSFTSFKTPAEVKNNDTYDFGSALTPGPNGTKIFQQDERRVDVTDGLINLRWLDWFIKTDYAKKQWASQIPIWETHIQKMVDLEPEERKKLLQAT